MSRFEVPRCLVTCLVASLLCACRDQSSELRSEVAGASGAGNSGVAAVPLGGAPASMDGAEVGSTAAAYLPARIRRLTNAEYDASVQALLGTKLAPSVQFAFPPDARQGPANAPAGPAFSVNDAQRVDPVLADKLDAAAQAPVAEARANGALATLSPCSDTSGRNGEGCAKSFAQTFGARAYRRSLSAEELDGLVSGTRSVYSIGAADSYADGIDLLTRVLLQSVGFLYVTELGAS